MLSVFGTRSSHAKLVTGAVTVLLTLGVALPRQASAAIKEVDLAPPAAAMTYCQSGKMPSGDIAYILGAAGFSQYGPGSSCAQQTPTGKVKKAILANGKRVKECNLVNVKEARTFCQSGAMGNYDIDYIAGKVGRTIAGPGYGCVVNYSSSIIGNALCKTGGP